MNWYDGHILTNSIHVKETYQMNTHFSMSVLVNHKVSMTGLKVRRGTTLQHNESLVTDQKTRRRIGLNHNQTRL
jgi:hypothetical protein